MKTFAVLGAAALCLVPSVTAEGSFSSAPKVRLLQQFMKERKWHRQLTLSQPSVTPTPSCLPRASMTGGPSLSASLSASLSGSHSLPLCSETPSSSAKGSPTPLAKASERVHARQIKRAGV